MVNGATLDQLVLEPGDIVAATTLAEVPECDLRACERMEQRHLREQPNERLVWFRAHGVVRAGVAGRQLVPARRPATVPA